MHTIDGDFDPARSPLPDADRLLAYLEQAHPIVIAQAIHPDKIDPTGWVRGRGMVTDGLVSWSVAVAHYVRTHRLAPPKDLLNHIRGRNYQFPEKVNGAVVTAAVRQMQALPA